MHNEFPDLQRFLGPMSVRKYLVRRHFYRQSVRNIRKNEKEAEKKCHQICTPYILSRKVRIVGESILLVHMSH